MSTSDQHQHVADLSSGSGQLTRKQLREARLTGSTPVITPEEAEAARLAAEAERAEPVLEAPVEAETIVEAVPAFENAPVAEPTLFGGSPIAEREEPALFAEPVAAEPEPFGEHAPEAVVVVPEPAAAEPEETDPSGSHLTRRQMREQERVRTASVPVFEEGAPVEPEASAPEPVVAPRQPYPTRRRSYAPAGSPAQPTTDEQDGVDDAEQGVVPVSVSALMRAEEQAGRARRPEPAPATIFPSEPASVAEPVAESVLPFASPQPAAGGTEDTTIESLLGGSDPIPAPAAEPTVNPAFGQRVFTEKPETPAAASFDALVGDAGGSHHTAPNALIFQQAPVAPSLSGPVASTGEILVTGSYDLPAGLGSRGHADGVADGKEVDVVLVDGELAPSSSPTPIAASAAIGTIKPAGEVIRPPEPEKGNRLMLALTITAGALAVALVGALIVAITTGAFS